MGLFLSYNYQGNNIDQLTSPHELKKYEIFYEIFGNNVTIYSLQIRYEWLQEIVVEPTLDIKGHHDQCLMDSYSSEDWENAFHGKSKQAGEGQQDMLEPVFKIRKNYLEMKRMLEFSYDIQMWSRSICRYDTIC